MDKNQLLDYLAEHGYALMQPEAVVEPEEVLENLPRQNDARLLKGFPVVLFNALKKKDRLTWESRDWDPFKRFNGKEATRWLHLVALSFLLFRLFGLEKHYQEKVLKLFRKCKVGKTVLSRLEGPFLKSEQVLVGDVRLSTERLKNSFRRYVTLVSDEKQASQKKHELELELLLSELFTPRQKDLLRKKTDAKVFTKTEREYFYRVVKKRLRALASDELHQMAKSLLLKLIFDTSALAIFVYWVFVRGQI
ncbi:MAG: hypothetical protein HY587_00220 [Candidatus Omnitrophica bacterium]|nr:hypothetical protein [Candidatus Omnitrophota bacterium]